MTRSNQKIPARCLSLLLAASLPLVLPAQQNDFTSQRESAAGSTASPSPAADIDANAISESQRLLPDDTVMLDRIVAIAEEKVILKSELDLSIKGVTEQIRKRGGQMPPADLLYQQALDRMIMNKLQVQRAEQTGIRVSDSDVDQALARVAARNNITIVQLREALERDGFEFVDFREELRDELTIDRLRERVVDSMPDITDTEIEIMLASEQIGGKTYNLSHILISVSDSATPEEVNEASERIDEIHKKLQNGLEFAAAAISYSDAQDALEGGNIGWRNINAMPTVFSSAIENLEPGEFTRPLRSPAGFHIMYLNDVRDQGQIIVDEAKVRHIMVATSDLVSSEEAHQRIMGIRERWQNGEASFAELAKQYSDDTMSANLGGDMGWVRPASYGERIAQIIESLEIGQASQPFQDDSGWHIMLVEDRRKSDITDTALRARARQILRDQKAEREYENFLRQLRDESYVEVRS